MTWTVEKPKLLAIRNGLELASYYKTNHGDLWFSVPVSKANFLSTNMDAALIGLLLPAMHLKIDLHLAGPIDQLLLYYSQGPLQEALINFNPTLQKIKISCERTSSGSNFGKEVVTGLSRGVDSFSVLDRHYIRNALSPLKGTIICLHDIWADNNIIDTPNPAVVMRFQNLKPLLDHINYSAYLINSNLGQFYKQFDFVTTHTIRNVAAAHSTSSAVGTYIYASTGLHLKSQSLFNSGEMGRTDMLLLPMLSSTQLTCISGDSDKTRLQKLMGIVDLDFVQQFLQVCSHSTEQNCSSCDKCLRTMFALDILDKIHNFKNIFDFQKYKINKLNYLTTHENDPFVIEILEFAYKRDLDPLRIDNIL